ncbi:MAG: hypothetical protein Tsb009_30240 [Planctomycetaceae bacterium]
MAGLLRYSIGGLMLMAVLSGCLSSTGMVLPGFYLPGFPSAEEMKSASQMEEKYRAEFQQEGSPEAIRWLKANRLHAGMTVESVNAVFGVDGERVYEDRRFKSNGGIYHEGDETYKWGPDSEGVSHLLVFRDNRLVNYNPKEFQQTDEE